MMKKNVNNEIFREYFNHQNLSALAKNLLKANETKNQAKNKQIVNHDKYARIDFRNAINKKIVPKMKIQINLNNH